MEKRHKIFLTAAAAVMIILLLRMTMLAAGSGSCYRAEASRIADKTGELSAIRGRIFDENEKLLVWSERCYDLVVDTRRMTDQRFRAIRDAYQKMFANESVFSVTPESINIVKYNLSARELDLADKLSSRFGEFSVELRWERRCNEFDENIGEVRQINGMEVGISGMEKEYDNILRGTPGKFTVMLDRRGRWINETFRIITPPEAGRDIYLSTDPGDDKL